MPPILAHELLRHESSQGLEHLEHTHPASSHRLNASLETSQKSQEFSISGMSDGVLGLGFIGDCVGRPVRIQAHIDEENEDVKTSLMSAAREAGGLAFHGEPPPLSVFGP